ncbi:MAG: AraC family transcriptional regulator [Gallionella sp.]
MNNKNNHENELIEFARSAALPGVELMMASGSTRQWRVFHEQYAFCTNEAVAADKRYRRRSHRITDSSTTLFEPGETHETLRVSKPQDFQVLFITPETMRQYGEEMEIAGQLHFKPAPNIDAVVFQSCKRLHAAILEEASDIELQSRLAECIGTLLNHHGEQRVPEMASPGRQPLLRARDLLFEQYAHAISLDEIAAIAGLSRFHFLKAFTAQFGLTPHAYQIHLRIERSLPLLRQGMSLTQVAETMGFNDQSHYIRHFKRIMGVTPGQYKGKTPVGRVVKTA